MTTLYALYGTWCKDILTQDGRPIVHTNQAELQWLLPRATVIRVTEQDLARRSPLPPLPLPEMRGIKDVIRFPLRREDFR